MAEASGFFRGDFFPQLHFDLVGVFGSSKTQQIGDTDTVGIANIGRLAVDITTDEIGCFAADAGESGELLNRIRDYATVFIPKHFAHFNDIAGLGVIKAAAAHHFFHIGDIRFGKSVHWAERRTAMSSSCGMRYCREQRSCG